MLMGIGFARSLEVDCDWIAKKPCIALSGGDLGIALMPNFLVGEDIRSGRFVHIPSEISTETVEISAIHSDRRLLDARGRQFIDLMAAGLRL